MRLSARLTVVAIAFSSAAFAPAIPSSSNIPIDPNDQGDSGEFDGDSSSILPDDTVEPEPWERFEQGSVTQPTQGRIEQAIGFYANGSLINASALPDQGDGFVKLFRSRNRPWGTDDILSLFQWTAAEMQKRFPGGERLQVGDIANKKGGSTGGHDSHQNGLDMDIVYFRVNHKEILDTSTFAESFVSHGKVTANFDTARNWETLKLLVSSKWVNRVFMDQAIKKEFCRYAKSIGESLRETETLRRMRPWPNHDDHFHLRIKCPPKSPRCKTQDEPPTGSGCS